MKTAFLFAGQGAQKPGMGLDLYESFPEFSKVIDQADAVLDFDLKQVMFGKNEELLNRTEMTQPALAAFAAAALNVLEAKGIRPDVALGLSLGEYSALHAAGVFSVEELIELTAFRGGEMAEAGNGIETGMCAVLGLTPEQTEAVCRDASAETGEWVCVVNYNTVGQEVISGTMKALALAEEKAKAAGAKRCMRLKVSSAFHTHLMDPASDALDRRFRTAEFHPMMIPVIFNTTGTELQADETIPELLVRQVKSPVRMRQSIEYLKQIGVTHAIEIGPGHSLAGFIKRSGTGIQTCSIEDVDSMKEVIDAWKKEEAQS